MYFSFSIWLIWHYMYIYISVPMYFPFVVFGLFGTMFTYIYTYTNVFFKKSFGLFGTICSALSSYDPDGLILIMISRCMYTHGYICLYTRTPRHTYMRVLARAHTHACTRARVYTCVHACIYTHMRLFSSEKGGAYIKKRCISGVQII
jgi:hypothetical protein